MRLIEIESAREYGSFGKFVHRRFCFRKPSYFLTFLLFSFLFLSQHPLSPPPILPRSMDEITVNFIDLFLCGRRLILQNSDLQRSVIAKEKSLERLRGKVRATQSDQKSKQTSPSGVGVVSARVCADEQGGLVVGGGVGLGRGEERDWRRGGRYGKTVTVCRLSLTVTN